MNSPITGRLSLGAPQQCSSFLDECLIKSSVRGELVEP